MPFKKNVKSFLKGKRYDKGLFFILEPIEVLFFIELT